MDRARIGAELLEHFETKWSRGDPWDLAHSDFERAKYLAQLELLGGREYAHGLEIGCGNGVFSRMLHGYVRSLLAIDISQSAIDAARVGGDADGAIDFRVANAMDLDPRKEGPWDLVVLSETIPYLGWLYPLFDIAWLASELFEATTPGGRVIMANTCGGVSDYLLRPWLIHTYRDLFRNVGYNLVAEEMFRGEKDGCAIESLICLYEK